MQEWQRSLIRKDFFLIGNQKLVAKIAWWMGLSNLPDPKQLSRADVQKYENKILAFCVLLSSAKTITSVNPNGLRSFLQTTRRTRCLDLLTLKDLREWYRWKTLLG